jgi:hypothetical protein
MFAALPTPSGSSLGRHSISVPINPPGWKWRAGGDVCSPLVGSDARESPGSNWLEVLRLYRSPEVEGRGGAMNGM